MNQPPFPVWPAAGETCLSIRIKVAQRCRSIPLASRGLVRLLFLSGFHDNRVERTVHRQRRVNADTKRLRRHHEGYLDGVRHCALEDVLSDALSIHVRKTAQYRAIVVVVFYE